MIRHTLVCCIAGMMLLSTATAEAQRGQQLARRNRVIPLFDGQTFNGWVTPDGSPVTAGWEVVDGTLHLIGKGAGMILTDREYKDFDLQFEWKITEGGNSGIKYRVKSYGGSMLGIEYQLLDDPKYFDNVLGKGSTGSLYALYAPVGDGDQLPTNPPGEFNSSRIVVRGNQITHWLNGEKLVSATVGSSQWHERVAASKFNNREGFGENRSGLIMLQEHGSEVWFRNVSLRELGRTADRRRRPLIPVVGHARR
jgi:hypothetical protein